MVIVSSGLSASRSHFSRMTRIVAAFAGLSCICSNLLMVLWAKLLYPLSARDCPTEPWVNPSRIRRVLKSSAKALSSRCCWVSSEGGIEARVRGWGESKVGVVELTME